MLGGRPPLASKAAPGPSRLFLKVFYPCHTGLDFCSPSPRRAGGSVFRRCWGGLLPCFVPVVRGRLAVGLGLCRGALHVRAALDEVGWGFLSVMMVACWVPLFGLKRGPWGIRLQLPSIFVLMLGGFFYWVFDPAPFQVLSCFLAALGAAGFIFAPALPRGLLPSGRA